MPLSLVKSPGHVRVLPTEKAMEALPEFDAISGRMMTQWIKDKWLVRLVLREQFPSVWSSERLVDLVHQVWMHQQVQRV
jgi:hypothetical protein